MQNVKLIPFCWKYFHSFINTATTNISWRQYAFFLCLNFQFFFWFKIFNHKKTLWWFKQTELQSYFGISIYSMLHTLRQNPKKYKVNWKAVIKLTEYVRECVHMIDSVKLPLLSWVFDYFTLDECEIALIRLALMYQVVTRTSDACDNIKWLYYFKRITHYCSCLWVVELNVFGHNLNVITMCLVYCFICTIHISFK